MMSGCSGILYKFNGDFSTHKGGEIYYNVGKGGVFMGKVWKWIKDILLGLVGVAALYGAQIAVLSLLVLVVPFFGSCGDNTELEDARQSGYESGYADAERALEKQIQEEWFSEGYQAALNDYHVEESIHVECPHCGVQISADYDGYVNDWWWK